MSYEILTIIVGALIIIGFIHTQTTRMLDEGKEFREDFKEARAKWLSERLSAEIKEARKEIKEIRAEFKEVRAESARKFVRI